MWRIKTKIKKPSHKNVRAFACQKWSLLRTQIQIPPNYCGSIGGFFVLLIRIALVTIADLSRGGTAGGVDSAAFGTYRGPQGYCGGENFTVVLCSFVVGIGYMLLLMGAHPGSGSLWRDMGCRFEGDHLIGTVLIFAVLAGLTFRGRRFPAGLFHIGFSGIYYHTLLFGPCGRYRTGRITVSVIAGQTIIIIIIDSVNTCHGTSPFCIML